MEGSRFNVVVTLGRPLLVGHGKKGMYLHAPVPQMAPELPPLSDLMRRPGEGRVGRPIDLLTNHFQTHFITM